MKKFNWPFTLAPGPSSIPKTVPGPGGDKTASKSGPGITTTDLSADFERTFTNLLLIQLPYPFKSNRKRPVLDSVVDV